MLCTIGFHWLAIVLYRNNLFRDLGFKKLKNSYNNFDCGDQFLLIFCSLLHTTTKTHYLLISNGSLMVIMMIDRIWLQNHLIIGFKMFEKNQWSKSAQKVLFPLIRPGTFLYQSCIWLSSINFNHLWLINCVSSNFTAISIKWSIFTHIWLQSVKNPVLKSQNLFLASCHYLTKIWNKNYDWNINFEFFMNIFEVKKSNFWRELKNKSIW